MTKFELLIAAPIKPRKVIFQHSWPQGNTVLVGELSVDRQRSQGSCECQGRMGKQVQVPNSGPLGLPKLQLLPLLHFKHRGFLIIASDRVAATLLNKYAVILLVQNF